MDSFATRDWTPASVKSLPVEDLPELAGALRERIIEGVSKTGGHLASNLGVVELSIALLRVFTPPADKILFDVSHQSYAYKLMTGRSGRFDTLRQLGGISGFMNRGESEYDAFGAGHSGTAVSAAMGFAAARDLRGGDEHVVAVVGDGSISNGVSLEALNNVSGSCRRLIVLLNDNEMSISHNVGGLASHFGRLLASPRYNHIKTSLERVGIQKLRMSRLRKHYYRIESAIKSLFLRSAIFEELGLRYIGPVDGHDLGRLINALEIARQSDRPILVHIVTRKGLGYSFAEQEPTRWHGVPAFDRATGKFAGETGPPSYSNVMGETLLRMAREDTRVVALTAAMADGTGLDTFASELPAQFFDVGICEEHMTIFAAGLAASGMRPVVAIYSTFMQRAVDAVIHDIALQKLPVVLCLDRAGVVPSDGATHHGVFDIALLRSIPNLILMQPRDEEQLARMLHTALAQEAPAVIRYPRGRGTGVAIPPNPLALPIGKAEVLEEMKPAVPAADSGQIGCGTGAPEVALWGLGDFIPLARETGAVLAAKGMVSVLVDARFVRPLDTELLRTQIEGGVRLVATFENAMASGGFGSAVEEAVSDLGLAAEVLRIGWPDEYLTHADTVAELLRKHGLEPTPLADRIAERLAARHEA